MHSMDKSRQISIIALIWRLWLLSFHFSLFSIHFVTDVFLLLVLLLCPSDWFSLSAIGFNFCFLPFILSANRLFYWARGANARARTITPVLRSPLSLPSPLWGREPFIGLWLYLRAALFFVKDLRAYKRLISIEWLMPQRGQGIRKREREGRT